MKLTDKDFEFYKSIKELERIWEVAKKETLSSRDIFEDILEKNYGVYGDYNIDADGNIIELYSSDRW